MTRVLTLSVLVATGLAFGQSVSVQRDANLRSDPSTDNPPIILFKPPTTLALLETMKQQGYYHVRAASGQEGWIWAKNVMLSSTPAPPTGFVGPKEIYPDLTKTPGFTNPDVTQGTLAATICNPTFRTDPLRPPTSFTDPIKEMQMQQAGDTVSDPMKTCMLHSDNKGCYEEDHLISLENGGHPRDPRNLWPEPYFTRIDGKVVGARQKDVVENYVRNAICFGVPLFESQGTAAHASLTLKRGQEILTGDWYACYLTVKSGMDCK